MNIYTVLASSGCAQNIIEGGAPFDRGDMRSHGVCGLFFTCPNCGHQNAINVDAWPADITVPSFGPVCGAPTAASSAPPPYRTGSSGGIACPRENGTVHEDITRPPSGEVSPAGQGVI
jgi:hypothetical protein